MSRLRLLALTLSVLVPVLLVAGSTDRPALAVGSQIRTFVASTGSDANPCSRTSPCRTFAAALAQTASGGEVVALDTGGYGTLSISQSVTITAAPGAQAFIAPGSGAAITVNAGASDTVILRNLSLNSAGADYGVNYQAGGALHIENVTVTGFGSDGIHMSGTPTDLYVADTVLRNNGGAGIYLQSSGVGRATIVRVRAEENAWGIWAGDGVRASVRDTVASGNSLRGFMALTSSGFATMLLEGCVASGNYFGAYAASTSGHADIYVSNCMVTGNDQGIGAGTNGSVLTRGNNTVAANGGSETFSGTYTAK